MSERSLFVNVGKVREPVLGAVRGEDLVRAQFGGCCIINEGPVHSKFSVNMMQHDIESFLG